MTTYRKTEEALAALTPEQYRVTQQSATERPGTGALLHNKEPGIYVVTGCVNPRIDGEVCGEEKGAVEAPGFFDGLAVQNDGSLVVLSV